MNKAVYILIIIAVTMIFLGLIVLMIDFHNDYLCSNTTNVKWFIENNCMRYVR